MEYFFGLIIGIIFVLFYASDGEIFYPVGKFVFYIFRVKKYSSKEISKRDQNIIGLVGLIVFLVLVVSLIIIKNKFIIEK